MQKALLLAVTSLFLVAPAARSLGAHPTASEQSQNLGPCEDRAYRQFDFWTGDWDVFEVQRPTVIVARARVELILNGCVLHEVYEGLDGHRGESFTVYDGWRHIWHQTWVTNHGQLLTIEGAIRDGAIMLEGSDHAPDGKARLVRGTWRPVKDGVQEIAVRSTDGGTTWLLWFDLQFRVHQP